MKILVTLIALFALPAWAQTETVISERTVTLEVNVAPGNLKWSKADYAMPVVKVLVPQLADVTVLDHRNFGEGAPCLASYEAKSPEEVIQNKPAIEKHKFKMTLKKTVIPIPEQNTCQVWLSELIEGDVRGFKFVHDRQIPSTNRHLDDCR